MDGFVALTSVIAVSQELTCRQERYVYQTAGSVFVSPNLHCIARTCTILCPFDLESIPLALVLCSVCVMSMAINPQKSESFEGLCEE